MKELTSKIEGMLNSGEVKATFTLKINSVDLSSYLATWTVEASKEFAAQSATFVLSNDGRFNENGANEINVGDVVEFYEYFDGDATEFSRFYGIVNQRGISKSSSDRLINIVCLDYISILQFWDIDLEVEGTKVEITNETLTPNYLTSPNTSLAQVFDFVNDSISTNPPPVILIRNKDSGVDDPQYDGFEVLYENGQLKLGFPLNAKDNYDLIATSYWFYVKGKYVEDILEELITTVDGYGNYLFGESSAQDVIDNHLTETYNNREGTIGDTMTPNLSSSDITIETTLTGAVTAGDTSISVTSTSGFPTSGEGTVNGDTFTWTGKTGTTLTGIPATGSYAIKTHPITAYVNYQNDYEVGRVWYLTYSNLVTDLVSGNFTVAGGIGVDYVDKRYGRIILASAISITADVTCDIDYSFKTLQATGVELNKISFRSRELENRLEAIQKLRNYVAPNYVIRTIGNSKIWSSYLSQKTTADYTLKLSTSIQKTEDEDLYTRVKFYTKNNNPTNMMLGGDVDFSTTGETYTGIASDSELSILREEGNYYVYGSTVSGVGELTSNVVTPRVYVNSIAIDNKAHRMVAQRVAIINTTRTSTTTTTRGKCLPYGTLIEMEDGTFKQIQDIAVGEEVLGGKVFHTSIASHLVKQKMYEFTFSDNRTLISSNAHPFEETPISVKYSGLKTDKTYDLETTSGHYYVNRVKTLSTLDKDYDPEKICYYNNKFLRKIKLFLNKLSYCNICGGIVNCKCGGGGGSSTTSHSYYYYKIKFPHNNIEPSQSIIFYDAVGTIVYTLAPNYDLMNYGTGVLDVPGNEQNSVVEGISTATYHVFYSTDELIIDYDNAEFKISKTLMKYPDESIVTATYEYFSVVTALKDIASVIDGRWDTQVQTIFYSEPPSGYVYSILDLGSIKDIQALDFVAGFFKPDEYRTFDITFTSTMQYSTDGTNYYDISDEARNFELTGGEAIQFEEDALGIGFQARYLKLILQNVGKLDYKDGIWVTAITEISAYDNIVLESNITLISTSYLSSAVTAVSTSVPVLSTEGFDSSGTIYIDNENGTFDGFAYTGKTGTTFTGVTGITSSHLTATMVVKEVEGDTTLYDYNKLLPKLGDRVFKMNKVDENVLYSQTQADTLAKSYLYEFVKDHNKISEEVLYCPHMEIGATVRIIEPFNGIDRNYFIESIKETDNFFSLVLAYYP